MVTEWRAIPYLNWGMWVARCPRPGCAQAEKRGPCDDGSMGGLEADRFTCRASHGGCGLTCGVDWPANICDVERVVMGRPAPATRNWYPGEDIGDLIAENIANGFLPSDALNRLELAPDSASAPMLSWENGEITAGVLGFDPAPALEGHAWRG